MQISALPAAKKIDGASWRSVLNVREQLDFLTMLSSMTKEKTKEISAAAAPDKELSPMLRYLRMRLETGGNDLISRIPKEMLEDLKSRYDPEKMTVDDFNRLVDELAEKKIIAEEDKIKLIGVRPVLGGRPSQYAQARLHYGDLDVHTLNALEIIDAEMEFMGEELAWASSDDYARECESSNFNPQAVQTETADWLNHQMGLRNLLYWLAE